MEDKLNSKKRYMPGIDGLRALSVLAVIAYHLNMKWAHGGLIGVAVFFVISGYLITDQILIQKQRYGKVDLKEFWIRRARRLLPAMFCMLLFVAIWLLLLDPERLIHLKGDYLSSIFYINNWWLIFHQVSYFESFGPPSPIGHLWSLSIEEQFYLIWPLLLLFVHRRGKLFIYIAAAAIASALLMAFLYVPGSDPSRVYYGTDTRMFGLLIGAALAVIWPSHKLKSTVSKASRFAMDFAGAAGLVVLLVLMYRMNEYDAFLYQGGFLGLSVLTAVIIAVLAHPASLLGKMMGIGPLRWIGVRSYSLYIWHYPVIILTNPANQASTPSAWLLVLQVLASFVLAVLSYRFVEEPLRRGSLRLKLRNAFSVKWLGVQPIALIIIVPLLLTPSFFGNYLLKAKPATVPVASQDNEVNPNTDTSAKPPTETPEEEPDHEQSTGAPKQNNTKPVDHTAQEHTKPSGAGTQEPQHSEKPENTPESTPDHKSNHTSDPKSDSTPESTPDSTPDSSTDPSKVPTKDPSESPGGTTQPTQPPDQQQGTDIPKEPVESKKPPVHQSGKGITVIGDSVILDAAPYLEKHLPGIIVDGKVGRQMREAQDVIDAMKADRTLGSIVIIELGTNGVFTSKQLLSLIKSLDKADHIYFVNTRVPRSWQDAVNKLLPEAAKSFGNVTVIDWYSASEGKDEFFSKDGVHLKRTGAEFYASMLVDAIVK